MRRVTQRWAAGIVVCALLPVATRAQKPESDARVMLTMAAIRLHGTLAEAVWRTADSITAFTQTDPVAGHAGIDRTAVRLLTIPDGLCVGLWADAKEPSAIRLPCFAATATSGRTTPSRGYSARCGIVAPGSGSR